MGTLAGLGWLREAPRPRYVPPVRLDPERLKAQEALKKCMFIPPVRDLARGVRAAKKAPPAPPPKRSRPLSEDPLVVGLLLTLVPPLGFVLLWTSPRYTDEARRAVTMMMALVLVLATLLASAALMF